MRESHGVRAHLFDESYILFVHLGSESVAHTLPVLMTGHALDLQVSAVQEKAFVAVEGEISERGLHLDRVAALYRRSQCVKIGIVHIPKVRRGDFYDGFAVRALCLRCAHGIALRIVQHEKDGCAFRAFGHLEVDGDLPCTLLLARRHPHARAVRCGQEMFVGTKKQIHSPVKSAVEGEVRHGRVYRVVRRIVHRDLELPFLPESAGELRPKCRVAPFVPA